MENESCKGKIEVCEDIIVALQHPKVLQRGISSQRKVHETRRSFTALGQND
jgi:hypothetical protein